MKTHDIGILLCSMLTLPVQAQHRLSGKVDTENIRKHGFAIGECGRSEFV